MRRAFATELRDGPDPAASRSAADCAILAVVGDGMAGSHGVAAKVFGALGDAGGQRARDRAGRLGAQHLGGHRGQATRRARCAPCTRASTCRRTRSRSALIGPGIVGARAPRPARLAARAAARADARSTCGCAASSTSKRMLLADGEIELGGWREALQAQRRGRADLARVRAATCTAEHLPHAVIIDCSASAEVAAPLPRLARGRHPRRDAEQEGQQRRRSATTSRCKDGAPRRRHALPLRGDRRRRPAGDPDAARPARDRRRGRARSRASSPARSPTSSTSTTASSRSRRSCATAKQKGYTEPDPRDDLSGTDVARKLIILAREIGLDARARRRHGREPGAGGARRLHGRGVPRAAARATTPRCASATPRPRRPARCCATSAALDAAAGRATVGLGAARAHATRSPTSR